jgi:hypothetical protein
MKELTRQFYLLKAAFERNDSIKEHLVEMEKFFKEEEKEPEFNFHSLMESLAKTIQKGLKEVEDQQEFVLYSNEIAHMRDHAIGLLEVLYGDSSTQNFEFHLEEMLGPLDLKLPKCRLKIRLEKLKS